MKKTVGLFFRSDLPSHQIKGFASILESLGLIVRLKPLGHRDFRPTTKKNKPQNGRQKNSLENPARSKEFSMAISLGGDGTYLKAFHELGDPKIPLIGFHLGRLGFLTPFQVDQFEEVMRAYLQKKLVRSPRGVLSLFCFREGKKVREQIAINDVVLERGIQTRLITTRVFMGKRLINDIRADGLIVSTAMGSTAYNLAAGGPILHPAVRGMILCAISPHSIANRPLVLPENQEIRLSLLGEPKVRKLGRLVVDGMVLDEIRAGDEVRIKMGKHRHWVYRWKNHDDFALMREKIRFGDNWVLPPHRSK